MGVSHDEVSDPSDWLHTSVPALSSLDAALRCQVCKEFYDTPMITSCSHTFCSLCIRRCLSNDGKCPTCRSEDQSSKLRRNWTVQECVDAFVKSRKHALELAKSSNTDDHPKRKRRKISGEHESSQNIESTSTRQTRSSARINGRASVPASQEVVELDNDSDDDYKPAQEEEPKEPDDGLVACPMCNKRMKEENVFSHLDRCNGQQAKATPPPILPQPRSAKPPQQRISSPAKHLPHLNYSLLRDPALKKKLQELGIPTWGNRQLLIRRHTQWIDIFNANSDSPKPKSNRELLRDLDVWEKTQGGHAPGQGQTGPTGVMKKDFDGSAWTGQHKSQFDDLIAQARAKRKSASAPSTEKSEQEPGTAMEGVVSNGHASSESMNNHGAAQDPRALHKIDTAPNSTPPAMSQELTASPVASMLHSAAQDVRRRSSISGSPVTKVPGLISTHSIPSASPTPAPSFHTTMPDPTQLSQGRASLEHQRKSSSILSTEDSLPEKLADSGVKKMPMFQVPEDPIDDVEIGANGGG